MQQSFHASLQKALQDIRQTCASQGADLLGPLDKVNSLQHSINSLMVSPTITEQISEALALLEGAIQKVRQARILDAIQFEGMNQRYHDVSDAQKSTFEWILHPDHQRATVDEKYSIESDSDPCNDAEDNDSDTEWFESRQKPFPKTMLKAANDSQNWLCHDRTLFHIAGKPGSGKSTLTKFLFEHSRTSQLLTRWAGSKRLVRSSFFFWKPGNLLQKSTEGLLRCLCHSLLEQCPEVISDVFPEQWQRTLSLWDTHTAALQPRDIHQGFERLIQHSLIVDGCRIALSLTGRTNSNKRVWTSLIVSS